MPDQLEEISDQGPRGPVDEDGPKLDQIMQARGYQMEMFEESMRQNIIVAMDTGSGKTHVYGSCSFCCRNLIECYAALNNLLSSSIRAVMRIEAELERLPLHKLVWFLAPTVALCEQQYRVLQLHLPVHQARFLSGDIVDRWSDQRQWDAILKNIRIVVSTHQVLSDALTHGFVKMEALGLMVFDEAHHCIKNHPANRIMRDFYRPLTFKGPGCDRPHILGLSASPIITNDKFGIQVIEGNLDAIARSPKRHREDLLKQVHHPALVNLFYPRPSMYANHGSFGTQTLRSLLSAFNELDIRDDPWVISLKSSTDPRDQAVLQEILVNHKTYTHQQIQLLVNRSINIYQELGGWAADIYISFCIRRFKAAVVANDDLQLSYTDEEKRYVYKILDKVYLISDDQALPEYLTEITDKVRCLLKFLVAEASPTFAGIVFAERRATVAVLSQIIALHPDTRDLFKCGAFVGLSGSSRRKRNIADLAEIKDQWSHLDEFRDRSRNLIVATSVLEEGIDVPGCKVVVCFDRIPNVKSFIQRRGRARQAKSKLALLLEENSLSSVDIFHELEREMKRIYEDDQREFEALQIQENELEQSNQKLQVNSTGALLTFDNAKSHLYHFCNTLSSDAYVDRGPRFSIEEDRCGNVRARVVLPLSVDPSVRTFIGKFWWRTEKAAKKDAAFEAYVGLYNAGLINDNLLPLRLPKSEFDRTAVGNEQLAVLSVDERLDPWAGIAQQITHSDNLIGSKLTVEKAGQQSLDMLMWLPHALPSNIQFQIQWDIATVFSIALEGQATRRSSTDNFTHLSEANYLLYNSVYRSRIEPGRLDFPALFTPNIALNVMQSWTKRSAGALPASDALVQNAGLAAVGLVRNRSRFGAPHVLQRTKPLDDCPDLESIREEEDLLADGPYLEVCRLSKRTDFLHALALPSSDPGDISRPPLRYLPISQCDVDILPFIYAQFALFIPSIMHQCGKWILAQRLCETTLSSVEFNDLDLVVTALCASSAREAVDYQRLEFLGDSILKFSVSLQLMDEHGNWHEGYLSAEKDRLVSNSRLSKASTHVGLDKYILTKAFTGSKWRPNYISNLLRLEGLEKREMSSKVLADVVEALIGAAFIDGGYEKAFKCLKVFLPEVNWLPLEQRKKSIYDQFPSDQKLPPVFTELEVLVGHNFGKKRLLLEAMTHASFSGDVSARSYQRLEFLGDAVLENLVVSYLFRHNPQLSVQEMHLMKTALVNANFLAFLCLEWLIEQDRIDVLVNPSSGEFEEVHAPVQHHFWKFMRHNSSAELVKAQRAVVRRHAELREQLKNALVHGNVYPWASLASLGAEKFFSDIVESLLGAVYLDASDASSACEKVAERIGILPYLRRLVSGQVHMLHPKEELGRLASNKRIRYTTGIEEVEGNNRYWCSVSMDEEKICRVSDGVSRVEVETRAADNALKVLFQERPQLEPSLEQPGEAAQLEDQIYSSKEGDRD
ncbi:hypothetical protein L228DRAFT_214035 [Xylona heveae TC161]|uniref:Dicer-like protein 2 n=1 Tax=Xylona heveae (strain CBS 132557 / TC161) TaxID=1328760 RepID=A0A165A6C8_XYLHT|nr:hypothetical protein L228DRAFT_214035 [Xylona heveae TC161]KZF20015.1 hypothetical protein L228DRAFT_214035 [Xylona heveae TC161]